MFIKYAESKTCYNEMKMDLYIKLKINKDFNKEKYITSTRGYGIYMDEVKGNNLQVYVRTEKNGLIKIIDTDYVYTSNAEDIKVDFDEVGSYEAMFENGLNLEHLKAVLPDAEAGFVAELLDMLLEKNDESWEIPITEGDIKITVESGIGNSKTSLVYYI